MSDCCIHFISVSTTTAFYIATERDGFAVFASEWKLQRIVSQPVFGMGLISL